LSQAINAQIEAALNKPTVIPTINFRSRRKTLGKHIQPSTNDTPPAELMVVSPPDIIKSPQTNGIGHDSSELATEVEKEAPDVSAAVPEVETHAEDIPAGDVIEKRSTDLPILNGTITTYKEAPISIPESVRAENVTNQESELDSKLAEMELIFEVGSHPERPRLIPRAMPSSMRVPIETPSEDLENEPKSFEETVTKEEIDAVVPSIENPPTHPVDTQPETTILSNEGVQEEQNELQHADDLSSASESTLDAETVLQHEELDSRLPSTENVSTVKLDQQAENVPPPSEDAPAEEDTSEQNEDEHSTRKDILGSESGHEHPELNSPVSVEETTSTEIINTQPETSLMELEAVTQHEESGSDLREDAQPITKSAPKPSEDGSRGLESSSAISETLLATEEDSPQSSFAYEPSDNHTVADSASEVEVTATETTGDLAGPGSDSAHLSNANEASENISEVEEGSQPEHHEESVATKFGASIEHESKSGDLNLGAQSDESHPVVDEEPMVRETSRDSAQPDHHEESTSTDGQPAIDHESAPEEILPGSQSEESYPAADEERSVQESSPISQETCIAEDVSPTEQDVEQLPIVEDALSPELPPVQLDSSLAETPSAAAHELPSLDGETREDIEVAVPVQTNDLDNGDESREECSTPEEPAHTIREDPDSLSSHSVPIAKDHDAPVEISSAGLDESSHTAESEQNETSDIHTESPLLSDSPPSSTEEPDHELEDEPPKEKENRDVYHLGTANGDLDLPETPEVEHETPGVHERTIEPAEQELESPIKVPEAVFDHSTTQDPVKQVRESSNETLPGMETENRKASMPNTENPIEILDHAPADSESPKQATKEDRSHTPKVSSVSHSQVPASGEEDGERPQTPTQQQATVVNFPSTPSAQIIHQTEDHSLAESRVTVLNADDLFADDDDDEYEEQYQHNGHGFDSESEHEERRLAEQEPADYAKPIHDDVSEGPTSWRLPSDNGDNGHESEHNASSDHAKTPTSLFTSLVDTIKSDLPIVSKMVNGSTEQSPQEVSNDIENDTHMPGEFEVTPQDDIPEHEYPHDIDSSLHIRTHTADTVPSFESYAHSDDGDSSPVTPIDEIAEHAGDVLQTERLIRSSWPAQAHDVDSHEEEAQDLKPQASPIQADFDPFSTQQYPSYITPKTSQANLKGQDTLESDFHNSPSESEHGRVQEPKFPPLNTDLPSRPYDSPPSATHSQHDYDPQPSRLPRRPTATDRTSISRTPVSSPSIPSNSIFQKTRSLFESSSTQPTTPPTRPLSSLFNISGSSSPSPPPKPSSLKSQSRPSSLHQTDELIVPRSLDAIPKPPSAGFVLPDEKNGDEDVGVKYRTSSSFLGVFSKLVGSGGLEDSIHNPDRAPLLQNQEKREEY
jgi:hypothetical protein